MGPVGHASGGFVYIAISCGLQSENTCTDQAVNACLGYQIFNLLNSLSMYPHV